VRAPSIRTAQRLREGMAQDCRKQLSGRTETRSSKTKSVRAACIIRAVKTMQCRTFTPRDAG
jgi:hypothetical protein